MVCAFSVIFVTPLMRTISGQSFVGDIRAERGEASIIDAIVAMARGLHLDLVAEGVENRTQLKYLQNQGCEEVQGYIFSPAVPAADLVELLQSNTFDQVLVDKNATATV